ncbi:MAG: hypothetical protein GX606_07185 [Elusimicrobia bacterium]|nr:hypothetical protein [Elusimicrobiota bacterium]
MRRKTGIVPEVVRLPWEIAMEALEALEPRVGLLRSSEDVKAYYSRLSEVLREYIGSRFGVRAPEMTTDEFMAVARSSAFLSAGQKVEIGRFLEACDRVKFAKYLPEGAEAIEGLRMIRAFVLGTIPQPDPQKG